jgi:hypothetical protein
VIILSNIIAVVNDPTVLAAFDNGYEIVKTSKHVGKQQHNEEERK